MISQREIDAVREENIRLKAALEAASGDAGERGVYSGPMIDALLEENATLRTEKHADAEAIGAMRDALDLIATHRAKCHAHDDDMGHQRRDFDAEDVKLMEYAARAALKGSDT